MAELPSNSPADAFVSFLRALDLGDWAGVRRHMAEQVETDYQSLFGAAPGTAAADDIVAQWRSMLTPLDATQHLISAPAVSIEGTRARVEVSVRGYHLAHGIPGGDEWLVAGQYEAELEQHEGAWLLTRLRLDAHYQTGNRALLQRAGERARALPQLDAVSCERVRFTSMGERLTGVLYRPERAAGPLPGVVVLGSWTTVKEQMAANYAERLARAGYAALAFDPRGHGESGGAERDVESPTNKIADVEAAAAWLARREDVRGDQVGALGICAGGAYVAGAASRSGVIGRLALVAPWLHDAEAVRALYGDEEGVAARKRSAASARARYEAGGKIEYVPACSETDERAAMFGPFAYYLDAERGAIDAWPNRFAVMAWDAWLDFDPHPFAAGIGQPTLLVHSKEAALPDAAARFVAGIQGPARTEWMAGTQFDFYDDGATLDAVVAQLREHFA